MAVWLPGCSAGVVALAVLLGVSVVGLVNAAFLLLWLLVLVLLQLLRVLLPLVQASQEVPGEGTHVFMNPTRPTDRPSDAELRVWVLFLRGTHTHTHSLSL